MLVFKFWNSLLIPFMELNFHWWKEIEELPTFWMIINNAYLNI